MVGPEAVANPAATDGRVDGVSAGSLATSKSADLDIAGAPTAPGTTDLLSIVGLGLPPDVLSRLLPLPALTVPALDVVLGRAEVPLAARLATEAVVTTGGVAMAMAFLAFGKRRRDEEAPGPDSVLRSAASTPPDVTGHSFIADPSLLQPAAAPAAGGSTPPDEIGMPRWRRPSLMQARRADPNRAPLEETRSLTFAHGAVAPVDGYERRLLRYRLVSLLDTPDEVRGREVAVLDQGDEVQLLQRSGAYWLVLAPDGSRGWLHRMTLGETVVAANDQAGSALAAEDEDVLMGDVRHEGSWIPVGS